MIAEAVEAQIERMLAEGRDSQRRIAWKLGVARGTVNAIARGLRPARLSRDYPQSVEKALIRGPVAQCPGCGGLIYLYPCVACEARKPHRKPFGGNGKVADPDLSLKLSPVHGSRFEDVRRSGGEKITTEGTKDTEEANHCAFSPSEAEIRGAFEEPEEVED